MQRQSDGLNEESANVGLISGARVLIPFRTGAPALEPWHPCGPIALSLQSMGTSRSPPVSEYASVYLNGVHTSVLCCDELLG